MPESDEWTTNPEWIIGVVSYEENIRDRNLDYRIAAHVLEDRFLVCKSSSNTSRVPVTQKPSQAEIKARRAEAESQRLARRAQEEIQRIERMTRGLKADMQVWYQFTKDVKPLRRRLSTPMSSLAELPNLIGFFSYSRTDDDKGGGAVAALANLIYGELLLQLGRTDKNFKLWRDKDALAAGEHWKEKLKEAVSEFVFLFRWFRQAP